MKSFGIFASVQFHAQCEIFLFKNAIFGKNSSATETGKWPDHSDRGDSMMSLVERTVIHTHTHTCTPPALEKGVHRHVCRIFVEIAIVTSYMKLMVKCRKGVLWDWRLF